MSIVNSQSNLTAVTNISSLNSSFAFCNISTLTCKNGNIINLRSTNCSFQNENVSYGIIYNLLCTNENVSYGIIYNLSCTNINVSNISCLYKLYYII